ncbi:hypothetical protein BIS05_21700, partial [Halomonas sp. BBD45]|nr:hypothetical protein [Halomonas sp. BBD45]
MSRFKKSATVLTISFLSSFYLSPASAQENNNQANNQAGNSSQANQSQSASAQNKQGNIRPIGQWNYQKLYQSGGMRADRLLEADVLGANG